MTEQRQETLEEFRKSFSYGSRTDLLFKFLASRDLTDQDAGEFLRGLLERLGDSLDTDDWAEVRDYIYRSQVDGYTPRDPARLPFQYDSAPWTPVRKPLSEARVALISAGGVYVEGDDPLGPDGPTQEEAVPRIGEFLRSAPTLSIIPVDTRSDQLRVRHPGYDIRGALRDYNVVFPIDRLKELDSAGVVGELANEHYSFVGASAQTRLLAEGAPVWAERLKANEVDAALLVAA